MSILAGRDSTLRPHSLIVSIIACDKMARTAMPGSRERTAASSRVVALLTWNSIALCCIHPITPGPRARRAMTIFQGSVLKKATHNLKVLGSNPSPAT